MYYSFTFFDGLYLVNKKVELGGGNIGGLFKLIDQFRYTSSRNSAIFPVQRIRYLQIYIPKSKRITLIVS